MKKASFVIGVMTIAFCAIFVSCKNDEPSIKFTYNEITWGANGGGFKVKEGDEAKILIEYNAPSKIKQIDYKFNEDEIEVITTFDKSKSHKIEKTVKFEKIGTVCINTSIVDQKNATYDFEMKINVE